MVCSLCLGIVGHRWHGCCRVERGPCYIGGECGREYVPSKLNVVCDELSRGIPPSELGLDEGLWVHLPDTGPVVQYIRSCDPRLPLTTWSQEIDHRGQYHQLLSRI